MNNQFNGTPEQIENNVHKISDFNPVMSEDAKELKYPNLKLLLEISHPVGSIYQSVNDTHPSEIFGGTWEQIKDVFLLSSGDIYSAGATGGEATHTLTELEIASHGHAVQATNPSEQGADVSYRYLYPPDANRVAVNTGYTFSSSTKGWSSNVASAYAGGGQAHNNMPPYLAVYMWIRTA